MGIDGTAMVSLIDQLEGAGLPKRRPSAKDRRAREISITRKVVAPRARAGDAF